MSLHSAKNGKATIGASDLAHCRNLTWEITSNNPRFGTSGTAGHGTSVAGRKDASGSGSFVHDTDDPIYDRIKPGDSITLLCYETATRNWSFPARVDRISGEIQIDEGGELTTEFDWSSMGAWTYPDGTVSS